MTPRVRDPLSQASRHGTTPVRMANLGYELKNALRGVAQNARAVGNWLEFRPKEVGGHQGGADLRGAQARFAR